MKNCLNVKVRSIVLSIICIAFLLSCDKDDDASNDMDFEFPLQVGNSWKYDYISVFDFDSLAESNGHIDDTSYDVYTLDIISYEKIRPDSIPVYNFYKTEIDNDLSYTNSYYNNSGDSLICYGYYHAGTPISPKNTESKNSYIVAGVKFNDLKEIINWMDQGFPVHAYTKEDSILYDPVTVYKYPFSLGKEWVYRQSYPWRMTKKVSDLKKLVTQAGEFDCWKVEYVYYNSLFEGVNYYDHISEIGLIKRTWEESSGTVTDEYGNIMGTFTFKTEQTLIEYDLAD